MTALLLVTTWSVGQSISLGTIINFVMFTSNGALANTGVSTIVGDVGSDLGIISGFGSATVTGTINNANVITAQAKIDLQNAYTQLISVPPTMTLHPPAFGAGEILNAGVYSILGAGSLGGNITLDGLGDTSAVFIFRFGGAYAIGAASTVILINGAKACHVYWVDAAPMA